MVSLHLLFLVALVLLWGNQIQSQIPRDGVRAYERGLRKLKQSDLDGAISELTDAILITSGFTRKMVSADKQQLSIGDVGTNSGLMSLTVIDPFIAELYSTRALGRLRKRDFTGAISDWDRAIYINPQSASAYNNRAVGHYLSGNKESAVSDWNRALKLDPSSTNAYTNRGGVKLELGDLTGALADLNQATTLESTAAMPYVHRGYLWIAAYQSHLNVNDLISPYFSNAESFVDRGLADFNRAIELDPKLAQAYSGRAVVEISLNRFDQAFSDFSSSLKLKPDQPNAYMNRGLALLMLGKTQEAEKDFDHCLRLAPNKSEELKRKKELARELVEKP